MPTLESPIASALGSRFSQLKASFASTRFSRAFGLIFLLSSLLIATSTRAEVGGTPQTLYRQHQVFGGSVVTGNTMMGASLSNPLVNSRLLSSSAGDVTGIPFDGELEGAYLFWSGSTLGSPDLSVDLTLPDSITLNEIPAERCLTIDSFGGFFACRADITNLLRDHPGAQRYNGRYTFSDLSAEPGTLDANGECVERRECQAKYAAWSLILVYSSPSSPTLRDVSLYDGFLSLDENSTSPGITQYTISGFDFPQAGRASISYFGLEGDAMLGVPPQDTDPDPRNRCATCFDFFEVNGTKLNDANNPPNNVFNSSSEIGYTLGVDLDTFDISNLLSPGDSQINLRVGSGDGRVNPMNPDPGGGGELFLLSYIMLNVDRNAPNFNRDGTSFTVIPDEAAPLERVVFSLRINNQGSLTAQNVVAQAVLPSGLSYFPGSFRVDGVDPIPGQEVVNPLSSGYPLGNISFVGDTDRIITFRASIDQGVAAGTQLVTNAQISANNVMSPTELTAIVNVLGVPPLGRPTKVVVDADGDDQFTPGEVIQYRINIPNPNSRPISGVRLLDQLPPYLDILQVISGGGLDRTDLALNRVQLDELNLPENNSIDIIIVAQIHDADQLVADGVNPQEIDGLLISNQAEVTLGGERRISDDPSTTSPEDPTTFMVSAGVDIRGNGTRKEVIDQNGGQLEPGDRLQYSIRVRNTGASGGVIRVNDPLPPALTECELIAAPQGVTCQEINGQWRVSGEFAMDADDVVRITVTARVRPETTGGTAVVNIATLSVDNDPQQIVRVRSPQLIVFSAADLVVQKRAISGSTVSRGGALSYELIVRNVGNRSATDVVIEDPLTFAVVNAQTDARGEWIPNGGSGQGVARWTIADLEAGGERRFTLNLTLDPNITGGTTLSNQAVVSYAELENQLLSDDPDTSTPADPTRVSVTGEGPLIGLNKQVFPLEALPGERVTYTLTVTNVGSAPLFDVQIEDPVPDELTVTSQNGAILNGNILTFTSSTHPELSSLDPGDQVTLTFIAEVVNATSGSQVSNQASARAEGAMITPSDDPSTPERGDPTLLVIGVPTELAFSKVVIDPNGGEVQPGDLLSYTMTVRLIAGREAQTVVITDALPSGLEDITPLDGGALNGNRITWPIGQLDQTRSEASVRFEATVSRNTVDGQRIANQAILSSTSLNAPLRSDDPRTPEATDPTTITVSSRAELTLAQKTVAPPAAQPGEEVIWTIEIQNAGPSVAQDVQIEDVLSEWLVDVDPVGGTLRGGRALWTIGDLGVNQRRSVTLRSRLRADVSADQIVANQATISGTNFEPVLTDNPRTPAESDPTQVIVLESPVLRFTKEVAKPRPVARRGEQFRYILRVLNSGEQALNQLLINDTLPSGIRALNAVGGVILGDRVEWVIQTLQPNTELTLELEVEVSGQAEIGAELSNQASLQSGLVTLQSDDPLTPIVGDPTVIRVIGDADLTFTKRVTALDSLPFRAGSRVRYDLEISNSGLGDAVNLILNDPRPEGVELLSSSDGELTPEGITWRFARLSVNETRTISFEARINQGLEEGTLIENQATLSWEGTSAPLLSDDPSTPQLDPTRFSVISDATLNFTKTVASETGQNDFTAGSRVIYTLRVQNLSNRLTEPVTVIDVLSPLVTANADQPGLTAPGITAELNGQQLTWSVRALAPGEELNLRLGVTLSDNLRAGQQVLNQAEAKPTSDPLADPILSDDPNTPILGDPTALTVSGSNQLSLQKRIITETSDFSAGGRIEYELTLTNVGNAVAQQITLLDPLPRQTTLISSNPPATLDEQGVLRWSPRALQPEERARFMVQVRTASNVAEGTVVSNQARVSTLSSPVVLSDDPNTPIPQDPTSFTVTDAPRIELDKLLRDVNGPPLSPGDQVEFSLILTNRGSTEVTNLDVIDPLSTLLINPNPIGGDLNDGIAQWRILQLDPGQTRTLVLSARVSPQATEGDLLTNQFAARTTGEEFTLSPEIREVIRAAQFSLTKSVTPILASRFVPGGLIRYTITLTNTGSTPLQNVIISDPINEENLVDVIASSGGVISEGEITWDSSNTPALSEILAGQSITLTIDATIKSSLTVGRVIINQAIARLNGGDPSIPPRESDDPSTPELDDATVFTTTFGSALRFTKDIVQPADRLQIRPGDRVIYELMIENVGQDASQLLTLEDLPDPLLRLINVEVDGVSRDPLELTRGQLSIEPILPRQQVRIRLTCSLIEGAQVGDDVFNQATLTYAVNGIDRVESSDDPRTPEQGDPTGFVVGGELQLHVLKTARTGRGQVTAEEGEFIEWSILITNQGQAPAYELIITDAIPNEVSYVTGSLILNGLQLTDTQDGDQGEYLNNRSIVARIPSLNPSGRAELKFQTIVAPINPSGSPQVSNQAGLSYNRGQLEVLSDNNDSPSDGVNPTVVPLEIPLTRSLDLSLTLSDPTGPPALLNELVEAELLIVNTGTATFEGLDLEIPLPKGLLFLGGVFDGDTDDVRFEAAPIQAGQESPDPYGYLRAELFGLAPGQGKRLRINLRVDPLLSENKALCLQGQLADQERSEGRYLSSFECFEGQLAFGRIEGTVFQDLNGDEAFDREKDISLQGFTISAWRTGEEEGTPVSSSVSSSEGYFVLENLRPGRHEVRVKSDRGVAYHEITVNAVALEAVQLAISIEPTGRIYESVSGDLIDGAEVFIYRDLDTDADPFDDESLISRELVPETELESPTQQGQRASHGGMYRFGVRQPGRYLIEVIPPGIRYVSPSTLIPPLPIAVSSVDGILELVPEPLPTLDPEAQRRYTLSFEVGTEGLILKNNHIALDPLSALIQIDKRSRKVQYTVGEVVTYEVDIINRSPIDLVYDDVRRAGGVYIEDVMPKGIKYVAGSAVWVDVRGARELPLFSSDPVGARILRFGGEIEREDQNSGVITKIQRPVDFYAGAHLRLRYQAVIGPNVKPLNSYENRARLLGDGDIPISSVAKAEIRVIADPDFDQGLLLGYVWCDADQDGLHDEGEVPFMGARIYFDQGFYAITDRQGKYHFKQIDPGSHVVKIDKDSLLPGAKLTTDELRAIYFSRGLPARVSFGVTCPSVEIDDSVVKLGAKALRDAFSKLGSEAVIIRGDVKSLTIKLGELSFSAPSIDIKIEADGEAPDLPPPSGGDFIDSIPFNLLLPDVLRASTARWSLWMAQEGSEEQAVLTGLGTPPQRLVWNGVSALGEPLAVRGSVLNYRFEVATGDLLISSPLHRFGIGVTLPPEPEVLISLPTSTFDPDKPQLITEEDQARISQVIKRLKAGYDGKLIIDVHASGEEDGAFLSNARAEAIASELRSALGVGEDSILAQGSGNNAPLITNMTFRSRQRNRRVLVRLLKTEPDKDALTQLNSPLSVAAIGRAGSHERRPDDNGRFILVTEVPQNGQIEVFLRDQRGASVTYLFPVVLGAPQQERGPKSQVSQTRPLAIGGLWGEALSLGGSPLPLNALIPSLSVSIDQSTSDTLELNLSLEGEALNKTQVTLAEWTLVMIDGGQTIPVESGQGKPPASLSWSPLEPLTEGMKIGLKLITEADVIKIGSIQRNAGLSGRITAESQTIWVNGGEAISLVDHEAKTDSSWTLKLGDEQLRGKTGTRVEGLVSAPSTGGMEFELTRPDLSSLRGLYLPPLSQTKADKEDQAKREQPLIAPPSTSSEVASTEPASSTSWSVRKTSIKVMSLWMGGGNGWASGLSDSRQLMGQTPSPLEVKLQLPSDAFSSASSLEKDEEQSQRPSDEVKSSQEDDQTLLAQQSKRDRFGEVELMKSSEPLLRSRAPVVIAEQLKVKLPEGDTLKGLSFTLKGSTHPSNQVTLNGVKVEVDTAGDFMGMVVVGEDGVVEVKTTDPDGNSAVIRKQYKVSESAWFLLAMGESVTGAMGSELEGVQAHTSVKVGDQIYIHGRAVAYLKGRMKGDEILGGLFKKYEITAHLDTAKQSEFEGYFRQMIDPDRYYPVYGDSAEEVNDVNSRGPLYVLVKADQSLLQVGNFRTQLRGIELLNYDRSLYGAQANIDLKKGSWRHEAQVFGATQDQAERHVYVELRGTGGSLYYLPHRELVEGSERIYLIERDRITNMERRRTALSRNIDYSIRYLDGRILMMSPVSSSSFDTVGALPQPTGSQVTLDGHPTFISVEYDHRDPRDQGEDAWGAYVRETWQGDGGRSVAIGGGFIQEQQGEVAAGHYRLWGGHLTYQHARKTGFAFEYAKSVNQNAENLFSQDGGLTFQPFSLRRPEDSGNGATSFLVKGTVELNELIGESDQDWIWVDAYWRYAAPGFYSAGNLQQQGTENYGAKVGYRLNEQHRFMLSYDEMATEQTPFEVNPFLNDYRRTVTRAMHQYQEGNLTLESGWTRTSNEPGVNPDGTVPAPMGSDVLSSAVQYKLTSKWTLLGEQEIVVRGDSRLYQSASDLFVTSVGVRYRLSEALQIEALQSLRWSGDNATQVGVRTELNSRHSLYAQHRLIDQLGQKNHTTVVGAEERFGHGARAFSEYQIESGQLGQRNRAVLGIGQRTQLIQGLVIDASYQRSQVLNNFNQVGGLGGDLSQDALSVAVEWLAHPQLKLSSRAELRFDDFDEWSGRRDQHQILTMNNLSYQVTPDLTLQLRFNYSFTEDDILGQTQAEFMEASFGAAYRPLARRWLAILFKATSRFEQRPVDLLVERPEVEEMGVISLIPIFELPLNLQLVEKLAYKRSALLVENLPGVVSHNLLWINRLNFHLTHEWDIGAEYRFLQSTLAQSIQHGALFEVNYIIKRAIRLGVGYNFTDFSDDEFARFDERYGGPFFRVMAHY